MASVTLIAHPPLLSVVQIAVVRLAYMMLVGWIGLNVRLAGLVTLKVSVQPAKICPSGVLLVNVAVT